MVTARFCTRWMILLISIFLLSACGGDDSTTSNNGTSEGTAAVPFSPPLIVNATDPHQGTVGNKSVGNSYYTVTGLTPDITYTITLYGLSADADLLVYNGFPFDSFPANQPNQITSNGGCASQNGGTSNEQCTVKAQSTTMNIEVDGEFTSNGATYFISVNTPQSALLCSGIGCFNFDDTFLPTAFVLTETGGGALWNIDCSINAIGGTGCSIHSTVLTNSQTSCFSYTAATTSTTPYLSFDQKVTSTLYVDLLQFYIDNVLQTPVWSGTVASQKVMFNTVSGTHTYKWCHSYTGSATSGDVWVDNIYIQ